MGVEGLRRRDVPVTIGKTRARNSIVRSTSDSQADE